jgi:uncharacterized membrane protein YqaE (UPF0057 family)
MNPHVHILLTIVLIFICPPLSIYILRPFKWSEDDMRITFPNDEKQRWIIICIILTILGWIPGVIYAAHLFIKLQRLVE